MTTTYPKPKGWPNPRLEQVTALKAEIGELEAQVAGLRRELEQAISGKATLVKVLDAIETQVLLVADLRGALQAALLPLEAAADALVPEARVAEAAALVNEAIEAVREGLKDDDCPVPCDGCEAVLTRGENCPLSVMSRVVTCEELE